ncbi:MAG TPA: transglycosylase SLT domain-containing protein [Longimicrobiaceae bacterium]|nr:transglycosylase SLT domain-containing protein [Longimicrobiaceae bacterium]
MNETTEGTPVAIRDDAVRSGNYVQSLIQKLEADVAARKQPRRDLRPLLHTAAALAVLLVSFELGARSVDGAGWTGRLQTSDQLRSLQGRAEALQGQVDFQRMQLDRLERVQSLSSKYGIGADLALAIDETSRAEGVDPSLAFEMVRVESDFNAHAVSPVGAVGYTQLMPATARLLMPGITREQLFDRDINLRLGFRFLRTLINHYDGDVRLALLAYNRGPNTVDHLLAGGQDPGNGYAQLILGRAHPLLDR